MPGGKPVLLAAGPAPRGGLSALARRYNVYPVVAA